jgi:Carboxypeptidase regulatory-like domain
MDVSPRKRFLSHACGASPELLGSTLNRFSQWALSGLNNDQEAFMHKAIIGRLLISFFFLFAGMLSAQNNRATMTGTVVDSTGAVVPGASVIATNVDTGVATETKSNNSGIYSVLNLPPGTYNLSVKKDGFKPLEFSHITLIVDQVAELNATFVVGGGSEAVTVSATSPVLDTETATIGTNMNGDVVTDLPMNVYGGRQAENFAVALTPGYSPLSNPYEAVVNGTQIFTKDFTVDGTSGTANLQGDSFESSPSMEALEELQAETSGLSARNGSTNGGVMMYNLKSGTNKFHGSAFGYGHNELLDANTFDNDHFRTLCVGGDTTDAPGPCGQYNKGESRFWDYGFSVGGPIIKNKTFFFATFERFWQNDFTPGPIGSASTVPTPAFLTGDFSALLNTSVVEGTDVNGNTIYQGAIFNPAQPGAVFVGNLIPSTMISQVSQKIVDIYQQYYAPELSRPLANLRNPASGSPAQSFNQIVIKLDHNISEKDHLSGSWVYDHQSRTLNDSGGIWSPGTSDGGPLTDGRHQVVPSYEYRVSESHTFSQNVLNVVNATYNQYWNGSSPLSGANWPSQLGFGNTGANNFPEINFGTGVNGYSETGIGNGWQGNWIAGNYIYGDDVTWTKGHHTLSFGGNFRAMQINSHSGSGLLNFNFDPNTTGAPGTSYGGQVGFGFASFLLGDVSNASESTPFDLYGRRKAMSLYAQDDFKVTRKLTLNLGLRWDAAFRLHEKNGNWANFDLNATDPNLGIPGAIEYLNNGSGSWEKQEDWKNFGPMVGFAYNPWEKIVFRGAFGITYVPIGMQYYEGIPYGFDPALRGTDSAGTFQWDSGYPGVYVPGTKTTTPAINQFPVVSVDPRALFAGYTDNINIGVQFQLTKTSSLETSYIGNRGHRLQDSSLGYNESSASKFFKLYNSANSFDYVCSASDATAVSQASGVQVPYPYNGFCGPAYAAIAPYPQVALGLDTYEYYPNLYYVGLPIGQSYYNSLVVHYVKRAANGLFADISYTLSKQQGDTFNNIGDSYDIGLNGIQNFANLSEAAHTLSPYDQTHVVKAGISYDLPLGRGHHLLGGAGHTLNAIVSGWKISPLLTYASGKPLSFYSADIYSEGYPAWAAIYDNFNPSAVGGRQFDPSKYFFPISGDPNPSQNRYFSATAATDPAFGQLGTGSSRIGALRGFGQDVENISLHKYFKVGNEGQYSMDFGVEFYNVLNRHAFADPSTGGEGGLGGGPFGATPYGPQPQFGLVLGDIGSPRSGQFEARFRF